MKKGYVYILEHNDWKCFKLWITNNIKSRLKSLTKTFWNFNLRDSYLLECDLEKINILESAIHYALEDYRITLDKKFWNWYTEFFKIEWLDNVLQIIKSFHNKNIIFNKWINFNLNEVKYWRKIEKINFKIFKNNEIVNEINWIVKKPFNLIQYSKYFSKKELDIISILLYKKEFNTISIQKIHNYFQYKSKWSYQDIKNNIFNILEKNNKFNIFKEFKYSDEKIIYQFKEDTNYVNYSLEKSINLKNKYSFIVYEYILSNKNNYFSINNFKKLLWIWDKYPLFANFKVKVLEVVQKELNESNININFHSHKVWKKIAWVHFTIT